VNEIIKRFHVPKFLIDRGLAEKASQIINNALRQGGTLEFSERRFISHTTLHRGNSQSTANTQAG
jgi:hypothetical protein